MRTYIQRHKIYLIRHRLRSDSEKKIIRYLLINYYRREHTCADLRIYGGPSVARIIALSTKYKFYCINSVEARLRARVDVSFSPRPPYLPERKDLREYSSERETQIERKMRN